VANRDNPKMLGDFGCTVYGNIGYNAGFYEG
jgi:hypothetical protein